LRAGKEYWKRMRRPTTPAAPLPPRLLGIDPGTQSAGWGVVEARGTELRLVACGLLKGGRRPLAERLRKIFGGYERILAVHRPTAAGLEETFAGRNPHSAIAMGEGRGVALLALARARAPVLELSPAEVKKAVTGQGNASKALVARMVEARLAPAALPASSDVTDALAVAIALAQRWPRCARRAE
jgi:crossover junction endodeoxyribonuclease RuvC